MPPSEREDMSSTYAKKVPVIIAEMEQKREEDDKERQADPTEQPPDKVVYLYPFEGGGIVMTDTPIEDEPEAPVVESRELETDQRPLPRKAPPVLSPFCTASPALSCSRQRGYELERAF